MNTHKRGGRERERESERVEGRERERERERDLDIHLHREAVENHIDSAELTHKQI